MTKYHINKHGVPAPCKAKEGNCPLGGDESHFDNFEQAQEFIDIRNEEVFGLLDGISTIRTDVKTSVGTMEFNEDNIMKIRDIEKEDIPSKVTFIHEGYEYKPFIDYYEDNPDMYNDETLVKVYIEHRDFYVNDESARNEKTNGHGLIIFDDEETLNKLQTILQNIQ